MSESTTLPAALGMPFQGGFYAGCIRSNDQLYALIAAPKTTGEKIGAWLDNYKDAPGASSYHDGMANTVAMAEAGSELANWARSLQINGFTDWYLPSRDELELLYRHLKPTAHKNYAHRNGDNPSSLPAGYAYTATEPSKTQAKAFREEGGEAMEPEWYWSSTQYSPVTAWFQYFDDGAQDYVDKDYQGRARAVRRFLIP
jgi:hypothetical protein